MILVVIKDTYEKNDIGYIVYKTYLLGILIFKFTKTTTQWDLVNKLKKKPIKQNIKGFKN